MLWVSESLNLRRRLQAVKQKGRKKPLLRHGKPTLNGKKHDPFTVTSKENRIYIRGEFRISLGMHFISPFQPEREFKV